MVHQSPYREVKAPDVKDADSTLSPSWWSIDSSAIKAGRTSTSSSQSTINIASTTTTISSSNAATTYVSTSSSTAVAIATPILNEPSGLSAGPAAGIAVGCTAAAAGIAMLAWLFVRERKKRRRLQAQIAPQDVAPVPHHPVAGKKGAHIYAHRQPGEPQAPPQELDDERQRQELE